ncbi:MAG TPA: GerMN domain-containing protein [Acidimicrobiales bacterium]|nr:GerMN domain-containing protein [Acidimicrobiales bacterium]
MRRTLAVLALVAVVATACGTDGATDAGPVPGRPETTVTTADTPATAPATTAAGTTQVSVWMARGEKLEALNRTVPAVPRIGAEAVKALLAGPTAAEAGNGYTTAVPKGTRFLDLVIDGAGIAKVDLSRDFESGGGTLGLTLRLAQVTCTVGQFPTVKGVRFALNGELVSVFSGNGIVLDKPVTCDSYREVLAQPAAPATFAGIWPFATKAELDAYAAGGERTYRDPVVTARDFMTRYVGMDNPVDFAPRTTGSGTVEVPMGPRYAEGRTPLPDPRPRFTVIVRQLGAQGASGPWTVTEVVAPDIVVTAPRPLDRITSPVRLTGQAHAFEGTVSVQVREDGMLAGRSLGKGFVTGGGDMKRPYSGEVTFRSSTRPGGAVLYTELSAADGQNILQVAAVRVRF